MSTTKHTADWKAKHLLGHLQHAKQATLVLEWATLRAQSITPLAARVTLHAQSITLSTARAALLAASVVLATRSVTLRSISAALLAVSVVLLTGSASPLTGRIVLLTICARLLVNNPARTAYATMLHPADHGTRYEAVACVLRTPQPGDVLRTSFAAILPLV